MHTNRGVAANVPDASRLAEELRRRFEPPAAATRGALSPEQRVAVERWLDEIVPFRARMAESERVIPGGITPDEFVEHVRERFGASKPVVSEHEYGAAIQAFLAKRSRFPAPVVIDDVSEDVKQHIAQLRMESI